VLVLFQLTANTIVFLCVNTVGIFVHNLMEHAQRKVFLDTRNCIAARLEMEDENEKLVSVLIYLFASPGPLFCICAQRVAHTTSHLIKLEPTQKRLFASALCIIQTALSIHKENLFVLAPFYTG